MRIANQHDLRVAYEILAIWKEMGKATCEAATALKREIREFSAIPARRFICDEGIDGYIEIERLPDWTNDLSKEDVTAWFEECRTIPAPCSPYDCTGAAFTNWFKLARRQGCWYVFHSVSFDV